MYKECVALPRAVGICAVCVVFLGLVTLLGCSSTLHGELTLAEGIGSSEPMDFTKYRVVKSGGTPQDGVAVARDGTFALSGGKDTWVDIYFGETFVYKALLPKLGGEESRPYPVVIPAKGAGELPDLGDEKNPTGQVGTK